MDWIKIEPSENCKMPENGQTVLIYLPKWDAVDTSTYWLDGEFTKHDGQGGCELYIAASHWMPLPEPPKP